MYVLSKNLPDQAQEVYCLLTGESYVYLEGDNDSLLNPTLLEGAVDSLPDRFYRTPWVIKRPDGQIRVIVNTN